MSNNGLRKCEIERRLCEKIVSDPDLKYYIDNDYIIKLVNLLIDGIAEVIEENNQKLIDNLLRKG